MSKKAKRKLDFDVIWHGILLKRRCIFIVIIDKENALWFY
jgi:hypothetical protein